MLPNLEVLLRKLEDGKNHKEKDVKFSPEFAVKVQEITDDCVRIIIHPRGYNGDTLDFEVRGNELKQLNV